jgi:hypothetical protein
MTRLGSTYQGDLALHLPGSLTLADANRQVECSVRQRGQPGVVNCIASQRVGAWPGTVQRRIGPDPANRVRTNPNREPRIKPTAIVAFGLALPLQPGATVQIDAENPPIHDLKKRVISTDLRILQNDVRPRVAADESKRVVKLKGYSCLSRLASIMAFQN